MSSLFVRQLIRSTKLDHVKFDDLVIFRGLHESIGPSGMCLKNGSSGSINELGNLNSDVE